MIHKFTTYNIFLCIVITILFINCGHTKSVIVNPDYDERINGEGVAVILPRSEVSIENPADAEDDLGHGFAKEVFMKFFKEEFPKALHEHSSFANIVVLDLPTWKFTDSSIVEQSFTVADTQVIYLKVPREGSKLKSIGDSLRFVLFIEGLTTSRIPGSRWVSAGNAILGSSLFLPTDSLLTMQLRFALWDNEKGKTTLFGQVSVADDEGFEMTKTDWKAILRRASKEMFKNSPLHGREID